MNITTIKREDGFGAQYQNAIFAILYAQLKGYSYIYRPIEKIEHNIWNDKDFIAKAESLMNLKEVYKGDLSIVVELFTDNFYPEVEQNLDNLDLSKIKELYWQNKNRKWKFWLERKSALRQNNNQRRCIR